ncbi:MAG: SDR family oxidoreductase [Kangiellaceae bacterium]|nr:SDR family oxidoreductase [Kangiellaceae bacterium]
MKKKLVSLIVLLVMSFTIEAYDKTQASVKAVLVTGASSGIGKRTAEVLVEKGYFVYAGARKQKDIDALSAHKNMQGVRLDVTVQEDIDAAVDYISQQGRGLYAVVNNAGVTVFAPLIEVSEDDMQFQMDVNLFGPYRVTKAFAPLIMQSKGRIVNISSIAGTFAGAMLGPYNMSKFAIEGYSEALAQEMKKFGVTVSMIEPGNYNSKVIKNMKRRMKQGVQQNDTSADSLYEQEMQQLFRFFTEDRSNHKDPIEVAQAVMDAIESEKPKLRYMVVPNEAEARLAITKAIEDVIQMNQRQPYEYDRKQLIELLDLALEKVQ